eukprot:scpid37751/ scgid13252/ Mitochondrial genome maintenance protein MGM101
MSAYCTSGVRRLLPACRTVLHRQYASKMVASSLIKEEDVECMPRENEAIPAYYGGAFSFMSLGLEGLKVSTEAEAVLTDPLSPTSIDLLPSGELLPSVDECKRRLNRAFGDRSWNITPVSDYQSDCQVDFTQVPLVEYALFINRQFVGQALGHALSPLSSTGSKARILLTPEIRRALGDEAKLTAFQRCCQELLIGSELSTDTFAKKWRAKYAEQVEEKRGDRKMTVWRRTKAA